jgi:hypothetical protein
VAPVYRAPMRSRLDEVDHAAAVEHALAQHVVGVGGRLSTSPADLDAAVVAVSRAWDQRVAARLRRFAELDEGGEVWTRDAGGLFHRGVLSGSWRYDATRLAYDVDLAHVRECSWDGPLDPPPEVLASFARGGRNFQRVRALDAY